jgi:hypothetical protein
MVPSRYASPPQAARLAGGDRDGPGARGRRDQSDCAGRPIAADGTKQPEVRCSVHAHVRGTTWLSTCIASQSTQSDGSDELCGRRLTRLGLPPDDETAEDARPQPLK